MNGSLRSRDARGLRRGVAIVVVVAYAYWFTDLQPFSRGATLALIPPIVILVAIAQTRRFRRRGARATQDARRAEAGRASWFRFAVIAWTTIAAAVLAWELLALRSSPRSAHPTISSFVESVEQYHVGRLVLFFAWLWLGWTLAS